MVHQNRSVPQETEIVDPDRQLLKDISQGDTVALHQFYERYGAMVKGFITARCGDPALAEEVLQDVMLTVWEKAHTFQSRSRVKTWLLVIARNRSINATRRKRLPVVRIGEIFGLQSGDTGPAEALERGETRDRVQNVIQQLPVNQREVLILVFYHQLSGAEVAEVLEISEGTVKSRLHRAKESIKRLLLQEGGL